MKRRGLVSVRECAQADFSLLGATIVTRVSGSSRRALAKACKPLASNPSSLVIKISFKFILKALQELKFSELCRVKFRFGFYHSFIYLKLNFS